MCRSSRVGAVLLGATVLTAGGSLAGAAPDAARGFAGVGANQVVAQDEVDAPPGLPPGMPPVPGARFAPVPLPFPPPPVAAPPRCPLIIKVGRGLERSARVRVVSGRPGCL